MELERNTRRSISKNFLLRIYRRVKAEPLKVWMCKDFRGRMQVREALELLVKLDVLERVPAIYKYLGHPRGKTYRQIKREVKAYRLKNRV